MAASTRRPGRARSRFDGADGEGRLVLALEALLKRLVVTAPEAEETPEGGFRALRREEGSERERGAVEQGR
jgi:hypothetical protein